MPGTKGEEAAPPTDAVCILTVSSAQDRERAFAIRRAVFQAEQGVPEEEEFDAYDETATHILAQVGDCAVGTGRLILHGDHAKIGRLAVLSAWRRHGVGRALMHALIARAADHGVRRIVLHAQVHAVPFYEALGFAAAGPIFDEAGIPHRRMERDLD